VNSGTALAILALVAYIGFEAYAIRKAAPRTEPAFIHNLMVEAKTAAEHCNFGTPKLHSEFDQTLNRVRKKYSDELESKSTEDSQRSAEQRISEDISAATMRVKEFLAAHGCDHQDVKNHFQRYRIYAGKSW
jgi:hypothetical protein